MTETADAFVAFGLTGDLGRRMTLPALYRLTAQGLLSCPVLGVGRRPVSQDELVAHAREAIVAAGIKVDENVLRDFASRLKYIGGDAEDGSMYGRLRDELGPRPEGPSFFLSLAGKRLLYAVVSQTFRQPES